ncbi:P-loop containing nucleoside triphosphate hydrolase protein [Coprinopsis sp. MPI-PUGE-AT-0042]|nr:P-loop containing nucleoside triphosphate hydrolase protein [Coprinopsis sp. MPI-PUGE-AT-0042]
MPPSPAVNNNDEKFEPTGKGIDNAAKAKQDAAHEDREIVPVIDLLCCRFTTPFEFFLNFLGLIFAATAGAAEPLMTLLFGRLTRDFVSFGMNLSRAQSGHSAAIAALPEVQERLKASVSSNAAYLVYIGLGMFVCTYAYMSLWRIRELYLKAILRQDVAYFDKIGAGEVTTRIQTDTHLFHVAISEKVAMVLRHFSSFVTGFVLAYSQSWKLALAMTSMVPVLGVAGVAVDVFSARYIQHSLTAVAQAGTFAEETISSIRTAQAFGIQGTLSSLFYSYVLPSKKADLKASIWTGVGSCCFIFVIYAAYGLAFSFGTTLINNNQADAGQVVNVIFAIIIGSFSLTLITAELQAITRGLGAAAKLYATIDRIPEIDSYNPEGLKPTSVKGEITFKNVKFAYPSRPNVPVLKGLTLQFRAGRTSALVGASGSGKSTIVSLVERFYDPSEGVVELDGVNVRDLNIQWLRSQIGLVSQEPTLFGTTIRQNVAHGLIGTPHASLPPAEQFTLIKEACIKADADSFINKLPNGYDTMVGERGFLLSGGQKQRIAIARAILSDPKVLLLDEATSALDSRNEGIVQDALDKAAAGRTTITIAHRLSTVKKADDIFVLGDGELLERGTHTELLHLNGAYARLVKAQTLRDADEVLLMDEGSSSVAKIGAQENVDLEHQNLRHGLASGAIRQRQGAKDAEAERMSIVTVFYRLAKVGKDQWTGYAWGFLFAILSGGVHPGFSIVFAKGIQGFLLEDSRQRRFEGDRNALWFFVVALASIPVVGLHYYFFSASASRVVAKLRALSFQAILRQDIQFFDEDEHSTGTLTAGLSADPQKINGLLGTTFATIVQCISTIIIGSVIGLAFGWKLALVGIACTPILLSTGYIRLRLVVMKDETNKKAYESSAQLACEAAGSIRTVAALTREADCLQRYSESLEEPLRHSHKMSLWSNSVFAISQATLYWVISLVFWYGSRLVADMEYTTLQFFVCLMATTFGAIQVGDMFGYVPDVSSARGAGEKILRLLDSRPEIDAESREGLSVDSEKCQGHIRFENVHFQYPTRPSVRVLRGLTLDITPGSYVALVGQSGCGKSTVIQLIERFYNPLAGSISLDGQRLDELNTQEYRKQIALVSQEPTLYAGTIRFNVLLGAVKPQAEVTEEEIKNACRDANILDFILSLPDGFETEVGGKGSQLSGGQKQRIAIARALLRHPKVLLLDEATSALDSSSEKIVQHALDKAAKGRTTIAVAHRLSTIQSADRM